MNTPLHSTSLYCGRVALVALALCVAHSAAALVVTTTADSGDGSLRQAIAGSPSGGMIEFDIPTGDPGYDSSTGVYTIVDRQRLFARGAILGVSPQG